MPALRLVGARKPYPWAHPTAISELIGAPADPPIAEVWLGAHPGGPAEAGSTSLADLIAADPERMLGPEVAARFGGLPFLPKLLAAGSPLSIQTHPDEATARAGFERENAAGIPLDAPNRNYRDANHKPELICAVSDFDALCGFRTLADCRALVDDLAAAAPDRDALDPFRQALAVDDRGAGHDAGRDRSDAGDDDTGDAAVLGRTLTWLLTLERHAAATMLDAAVAAIAHARPGSLEAEWLPRIARAYPGDPGGLVALLLNPVRLHPGQAIFLGAGNLHAYLSGLGVEVMANSDNVIRGGLTQKHVDIEELTRVVDATPLDIDRAVQRGDDGRYDVPVPEFSLHRHVLDGDTSFSCETGPEVLIVTAGHACIGDDPALRLEAGEAAFVPAPDTPRITGHGTTFVVGVNGV